MKIGRKKAKEIVEASKGKFITVTFKEKNGKIRTANGHYVSTSPLGYLLMTENNAGYVSVNLQTISELKANKKTYKIN